MAGLIELRDRFDVAVACDPDADRHGIVTRGAGLLNPNHYLADRDRLPVRRRARLAGATPAWARRSCRSSMIDRVCGRPRAPPRRGARRLQVVRRRPARRLARLRRRGERRRVVPAPRRLAVVDRQGRHPARPAGRGDHRAHGRGTPARAYAELTERFGTPAYKRIDAPADAARKAALGAAVEPEQVTASELAGEPITAVLTEAPGNGAPIGGLKVRGGARLVRRAAVGHGGRLQALRGEPARRGAPRAHPRRGAGRRGRGGAGGGHEPRRERRLQHRARRRRGQAARAAHRGPGEAGGAVRRPLPPDRLRALQPGQRAATSTSSSSRSTRATAWTATSSTTWRLLAAARQLRDARARADAARAALVRRLGGRHLPELQPHQRRAAGVHHRLRRRPHLPHGPAPDGRAAHRKSGAGGHRRRDPRAARAGRPVRRHRDRVGRPHDRRLPREAEGRQAAARRARPGLRLHGQLRLQHGGADGGGHRATPRTRTPSTTSAATSSPCSSRAARPRSTTSPTTTSRARPIATAATGATSGRSTPTTTPTWTSPRSTRSSTSTTTSGRSTPGPTRCRRRSSSSTARTGAGTRVDSVVCAGVVISGAVGAALGPLAGRAPALVAEVEDSILMNGVDVGRKAVVRRRDRRQERHHRAGARGSASTRRPTGSASPSRPAASWSSPRARRVEA